MEKTTIAILGSGSHIAKGLIDRFLREKTARLHLFTRSGEKIRGFLRSLDAPAENVAAVREGYADLLHDKYDVVVNCVGVGTVKKLQGDYSRYFTVNEEFDNLAISYLRRQNPAALYVGFSSGAVYGGDFSAPMGENTENRIRVNHLEKKDYYSIVRLNSEAKHRAFERLNIVDLRVFSYFSRYFDPADGYFITDVIDAVSHRKTLTTGSVNFVRDFIHPEDLFMLVEKCIETVKTVGRLNDVFDAISVKPSQKQEILDYFSLEYGLQYVVEASANGITSTGAKQVYCSTFANAGKIGHRPKFSSMDAIVQEAEHVLKKNQP